MWKINPFYTGKLFHCYILDKSICHFISFLMEILLAKNVDPDLMPHDVASDLGLHCLPMTLLQVSQ